MAAPSSVAAALVAAWTLAGCATLPPPQGAEPRYAPATDSSRALAALPPPAEPVFVAVYDFPDLTGQYKSNDDLVEYSRAVTQGAVHLVIEALQEAGGGRWFTVLERAGVDNLLRERQIIRSTREQYLGPDGQPLPPPPPLFYAPILIEGAIVGFDSNVYTGGIGARYLGVGGSTEYRHDRVTVSLRASSTQTGRLLRSVSTSKSIFSAALQGGVFRFVGLDELLEGEAGFTANEPTQLAVRRAIEKAVYGLVLEGVKADLWAFADPEAGAPALQAYLAERRGGEILKGEPDAPAALGALRSDRARAAVEEPAPAAEALGAREPPPPQGAERASRLPPTVTP